MNRLSPVILTCLVCCLACNSNQTATQTAATDAKDQLPAPVLYTVVDSFPHDTASFTEGLVVHKGQLFESTGHTDSYPFSQSLFGAVDLKTGKIQVKALLDNRTYFGEGIVFLHDKIYQLTYDTQIGFIYDAATYKKLGTFHYNGQGWSLTTDGRFLIMSNGSSNIAYLDPATFTIVKTLNVVDNNGPVSNINELELINGFIYANQWLTNYICKIDTASGRVVGRLDAGPLAIKAKAAFAGSEALNGIAFDSATGKVYVTGKLWPVIYQLALHS